MIGFYFWLLCSFSIFSFLLSLYSLSKQRNNLAPLLAYVFLSIALFTGGYALELKADSIEQIKFALKVEYFGAPFMSAFWMLLIYKFHFKKSASVNLTMLIMALPAIVLFLSVTNEHHHLIYSSIFALRYDGYLLSQLGRGPLYYVNIAYAYTVQVLGMLVFFRAWREKGYHFRTQAFWLFWGSVLPIFFNALYIFGFTPLNLDFTPVGLIISGIFLCIAIFRYAFLELQEIAKDVTYLEINEGILVIDDKNRLIDFNQACREMFSWLDLDRIGIDIGTFPEGRKILHQTAQNFEIKVVERGKEKYYEFRRSPLLDQQKKLGSVYFIQDISGQKEMIRKLHDIASYDSLTEVYNRRRLTEELEKELLRVKRYGFCMSVLMIDVDHLRLVNDQYGHQAGDEVLKALANTCRDRLRRTDIIGRYGGEEFLAVLPEASEENALRIAESIRKSIADLGFLSNGRVIHITVSIGVKTVYSHEDNLTAEIIINAAAGALFHAKNSGRNQASAVVE